MKTGDANDYLDEILEWFPARGMGEMDRRWLPPVGVAVSDEHGPAVAAFLYQFKGCPVGMIDWLIARPGMSPGETRVAARQMFGEIEKRAKAAGIKLMWAASEDNALVREFQAVGFEMCSRSMVHYLKRVS